MAKKTESRFRGTSGKYFTRQLFWDEYITLTTEYRVFTPIFSLHKDKEGLINFGKVYVEEGDPTGYQLTQRILDGEYNLWTTLMSCRWFVAAKAIWDRELDAKLVSEGMKEIRTLAKDGLPAQRLAAAKFLATKSYRKDGAASKGRPKQDDIDKAAKDLAATERDIIEDLKRIKGVA
jgi:hypothetical protein